MVDPTGDQPTGSADEAIAPWDALDVLRQRAADAVEERKASIADLRSTMSDQGALDEFGLNLGEIEE